MGFSWGGVVLLIVSDFPFFFLPSFFRADYARKNIKKYPCSGLVWSVSTPFNSLYFTSLTYSYASSIKKKASQQLNSREKCQEAAKS